MKTTLKHLSNLGILFLMFGSSVYSQSITNTLGTNGVFTIKDASNNYFTLSQSTGQVNILKSLRLENTTNSTTGIIYKGTDTFLHNRGTNNIFLGINSGRLITASFSDNVGIGTNTLKSITSARRNTAVGGNTLTSNTSGSDNSSVGYNSLFSNISGTENTCIGSLSLYSSDFGNYNTAVGYSSLYSNLSGSENTAIGRVSLFSNTNGYQNTAVGLASLYRNIGGHSNTAVGYTALNNNDYGVQNTAEGWGSLYSNLNGSYNVGIGYRSLYTNETGVSNTALGFESLRNSRGSENTCIGSYSGSAITTGFGNICIGAENHGVTTGQYNVIIGTGVYTGLISSGNNNIAIGFEAQVPNGSLNNQVKIGNANITYAGIQVPWTITSDLRLKSNVFDSDLGLDFISKIRPVSFTRNNDESQKTEYGFIAQEVEDVLKESGVSNSGMVSVDDKGMYSVRYNDFIAPIVKSIQELKTENDKLKEDNERLKAVVSSFKSMEEKFIALEKKLNEMDSTKHASLIGVGNTFLNEGDLK